MYRRHGSQVNLDRGRAALGKIDWSSGGRIGGVAVIGDRVNGIQFRIRWARSLRKAAGIPRASADPDEVCARAKMAGMKTACPVYLALPGDLNFRFSARD